MSDNKGIYNIEKARELAKDYTNATGIECLLLHDDEIYNPCPGAVHKEFCFQKDENLAKYCLNVHNNGAAAAKNGGQCVSYFCPMGLMHWSAPIIVNGKLEGAFIAGHVFFDKAKENITKQRSLSQLHDKILRENPELQDSMLSSLVIDDSRLNSLKHILDMMAIAVSEGKIPLDRVEEIKELLAKERHSRRKKKLATEKWQKLAEAVDKNDTMAISYSLDNIIAVLNTGGNLETEKQELSALIIMLYNKAANKEIDNYLADRCISALSEIDYLESAQDMIEWLKKNLRSLLESANYLPSIKNADMIYSALHYINAHYNERITLQQISDYVHFSPPYFSKIFKKELNSTFTQYLTKVRIEKSKELLADTTIPLSDIPSLVGFEEQSYFTKVFRAVTGISPGKYRDQIQ